MFLSVHTKGLNRETQERRGDSLTPADQSQRRLSTRERVPQMVEERHSQREERHWTRRGMEQVRLSRRNS